ncbi:MAG TPA: hypothetical protein VFS25_05265 [Chitinophaga sp.]|uniref:hypothetical protein n=1 Tax=Chitinophaga sp. TaxID=1869181 RepID=UPI002DBFAA26|nr:hypothetical protein [Chitinophaga sp.]HEU4552217.1 hypothetical protein [Chitinophaga sp.]
MPNTLSKRIATDPAYERTRENMAEFERAGKAGKLLTDSMRILANHARDSRLTSRMSKAMSKVIKTDSVNARGMRTVQDGDLLQLQGFEFNIEAGLTSVFFAPYTVTIDRAAGALKIDIPEFEPKTMINAPANTTHFSITSAASEVNFAGNAHTGAHAITPQLVYGDQTEAAVSLSNAVPANSTQPLFLALGIRFYQQVNGKYYPLNSGKFNALAIVRVDVPEGAPAGGN